MKTLVLSLLRLGDFLQQVPLLEQLRSDGQDVHVLVNEGSAELSSVFSDFKFHLLPRDTIQRILIRRECNVLTAFQVVEEVTSELDSENFDVIENWTHNFLSARLMDLLTAPVKKGARFEAGRLVSPGKRLSYLNETWGPTKAASFHWIDALARAMEHRSPPLTKADRHRMGPVYLQVLTSDEKKNWDLEQWIDLADRLIEVGEDVRILCAPFEESRLRDSGFGARHQLCVLSLKELNHALSGAKLVVTGDTSIAHWAALRRAPVLGLFLGSADPRKTAPRQIGTRILWSEVPCSPCRHRNPCSQAEHLCAVNLSTETVFKEVIQMIHQAPQILDSSSVRRMEVEEGSQGAAVLQMTGRRSINLWAQVVWDFYLNRDHENNVAPYASAARTVLQSWGYQRGTQDWIQEMKERLDVSFELIGIVSESLWEQMRSFNESSQLSPELDQRMTQATERLSQMWREADFVTRLSEAQKSSDASPFVRIRQKKEALQEVFELFSVQKNLVRVMDQEFKERGVCHGARA